MLKTTWLSCGLLATLLNFSLAAGILLPNAAKAADAIRQVPRDRLDTWWISERKVAPQYPKKGLDRLAQGCVGANFVIEADGSTSSHEVIVSHPRRIFDRSALQALKQWRFVPSDSNPGREMVFTNVILTFELHSSSNEPRDGMESILAVCDAGVAETWAKLQEQPTSR